MPLMKKITRRAVLTSGAVLGATLSSRSGIYGAASAQPIAVRPVEAQSQAAQSLAVTPLGRPSSSTTAQRLANIRFADANGIMQSLSDYRGRGVVLTSGPHGVSPACESCPGSKAFPKSCRRIGSRYCRSRPIIVRLWRFGPSCGNITLTNCRCFRTRTTRRRAFSVSAPCLRLS